MKKAGIINIGTELLVGHTLNTHANYLSKELNDLGYSVFYHLTVGDNSERILSALKFMSKFSDLIICTGGLGPTDDDITRKVISEFCDLELEIDKRSMEEIRVFFDNYKIKMTENNKNQAYFPKGSVILKNNVGTAPGFIVEKNNIKILALPGPPNELYGMMEEVIPLLREGKEKLYSTFINLYGIGESNCAEIIDDLFKNQSDPSIGIYAAEGMIRLRLSTMKNSEEKAEEIISPIKNEIISRLSEYVFSVEGEDFSEKLFKVLKNKNLKISFAESVTGGLLGKSITDVEGASTVFNGSFITYSNLEKIKMLEVKKEILDKFGDVSEETVQEMNKGLIAKTGADICVSVTGIAGPAGGTEKNPVGTIYISLNIMGEDFIFKKKFRGNRARIRDQVKNFVFFKIIKYFENNKY